MIRDTMTVLLNVECRDLHLPEYIILQKVYEEIRKINNEIYNEPTCIDSKNIETKTTPSEGGLTISSSRHLIEDTPKDLTEQIDVTILSVYNDKRPEKKDFRSHTEWFAVLGFNKKETTTLNYDETPAYKLLRASNLFRNGLYSYFDETTQTIKIFSYVKTPAKQT